MMTSQALLMLDDGTCFEGYACGACREAVGEVVFTTGMCGYQETLTDPSFYGQIVAFTAAHLGNYGVTSLDNESSSPRAAGAIFHELFASPPEAAFPHWRAESSLNQYLAEHGITAITGVDTRSLTLHIRKYGARNGIISAIDLNKDSLLKRARALPFIQGCDLTGAVTCASPYPFLSAGETQTQPDDFLKVAVIDLGIKHSILKALVKHRMHPTVWPASTSAEEILASQPDGILLSNGPGDPAACSGALATIKKLIGRVPMFGICLGHQLIGLSLGAKSYKLPFGHHGSNHPVKDIRTGKVLITSQNHGFCIDAGSLPANVTPSHWNLNDQTLEGIECTDLPVFSVQFHPEAAPGPSDAAILIERFHQLILTASSK